MAQPTPRVTISCSEHNTINLPSGSPPPRVYRAPLSSDNQIDLNPFPSQPLGMAAEITLRLRNDFSELSAVAESTTEFLEANGIGPEIIFAANLAIEELVTNIIKYGYDDLNEHEISIHLSKHPDHLAIRICDDGHRFNPFDQPPPDTTLPAAERDIGGLGIHFVRNMLDFCAHEWFDGQNIVTVKKNL